MTATDQVPTWTTKEGESIAIKDMADTHLQNTISMLRRAADRLESNMWSFMGMLSGEHALDAAEFACMEFGDESDEERGLAVSPAYSDLIHEAESRAAGTTWKYLDEEIGFGKYRSKSWRQVLEENAGYLVWVAQNLDRLDPDLRAELRGMGMWAVANDTAYPLRLHPEW